MTGPVLLYTLSRAWLLKTAENDFSLEELEKIREEDAATRVKHKLYEDKQRLAARDFGAAAKRPNPLAKYGPPRDLHGAIRRLRLQNTPGSGFNLVSVGEALRHVGLVTPPPSQVPLPPSGSWARFKDVAQRVAGPVVGLIRRSPRTAAFATAVGAIPAAYNWARGGGESAAPSPSTTDAPSSP